MAFTTTAIIPASDFTTPFRATWSMARQRLPELHPEPVVPMLTTGLTNGSLRATVLTTFAGLLSLTVLLSWTATVVGEAELFFPLTATVAVAATATGLLLTFAGAFGAAVTLKGSPFTGT